MSFNCYLAMTAAEFCSAEVLPPHTAWMACHFSCYGTGLSNFPRTLPEGSMLIVNDRTPVCGHDPELIAKQLRTCIEALHVSCVLLDLQRPGSPETARIAQLLVRQLPCPVGVTEHYARQLQCPVFLPPPPLYMPLKKYIAPWSDREIWLEAALENQIITVTPQGSSITHASCQQLTEPFFQPPGLHCSYHLDLYEDSACFTLSRGPDMLKPLFAEAETLGITRAIGLYQQLKDCAQRPVDPAD